MTGTEGRSKKRLTRETERAGNRQGEPRHGEARRGGRTKARWGRVRQQMKECGDRANQTAKAETAGTTGRIRAKENDGEQRRKKAKKDGSEREKRENPGEENEAARKNKGGKRERPGKDGLIFVSA